LQDHPGVRNDEEGARNPLLAATEFISMKLRFITSVAPKTDQKNLRLYAYQQRPAIRQFNFELVSNPFQVTVLFSLKSAFSLLASRALGLQ